MTTVIHVANHRAKAAAMKAGTYVYVGRLPATADRPPQIGTWGNRYSHLPSHVEGTVRVRTREEAISRHREEVLADPELVEKIRTELKDKVLGCWCKPFACHAETLAAIANGNLS